MYHVTPEAPNAAPAKSPRALHPSKTDWYKDAVLYELYVRAFHDADGDGHGDLRGVIERLDYIASLGVDCIWLLPIHPSPLHDDGYDISDFYGIHPDYGTLQDFDTLIEEAHRRGLRVITDLVMNHSSSHHPWFVESRSSLDNPKRDWYVWSETPDKYEGTRVIFSDTEPSNWTLDPQTGEYYWHRFFRDQPDLNYDNPEVQAEMLNVIEFWLERGIDGFRLDAIPYLFEREGTSNENLPETHAFLRKVRTFVDTHYPGTLLLGEVNQWPEDTMRYFGESCDEVNLLFHFPVMPRLFKALAEGKRDSVEWIMDRTPEAPGDCQWVMFLRNHDELTLEMVTDEERSFMYGAYAPDAAMRLNAGIRRRLSPLLNGDPRKIKLMNSLLMTLPGTPILYYGDELGMGDNVTLPDRHGVRTPMQWSGEKNAGFSPADLPYTPPVSAQGFSYADLNVASQEGDPESLLNWTRRLVRARKRHPALGRGHFEMLRPENRAVLVFVNTFEEGTEAEDIVLAVHNLSSTPQTVCLDLHRYFGRPLRDLFSGEEVSRSNAKTRLALPSYGFRWLSVGV